jgi:cytochrome P450
MTAGVLFNPFVPSYRNNPYLQLGRLREGDPVHRDEVLQAWVLTRYEDCLRAMRDHETFSSDSRTARGQLAEALEQQRLSTPLGDVYTVLGSDPPRHTRLRSLVNRAFTPRRVAELRPRIEEIARDLLAQAPDEGEWELMAGLAQPLPVIVIAEMLGVPPADRERFKRWSHALAETTNVLPDERIARDATQATTELIDYFNGFIKEREREPRNDLISALVEAGAEGERLTHEELLAFAILLLVAGNETTTNLIGNGMAALLAHPDALGALRETPEALPAAIEEMLRYDSPVQGLVRFVRSDTVIGGRAIPAGDVVLCMIGAANRDPEQFPEPERLDITRAENRHLSFGQGIHYCVGAPLARAEAEIVFRSLFERWPRIEVVEGGLTRGGTFLLRGPEQLVLRVGELGT